MEKAPAADAAAASGAPTSGVAVTVAPAPAASGEKTRWPVMAPGRGGPPPAGGAAGPRDTSRAVKSSPGRSSMPVRASGV